MEYSGDEGFDVFLEEIDFPRVLPEIKSRIMCALWSFEACPVNRVLQDLYDPTDYKFPDDKALQRFMNELVALWNLLTAHQDRDSIFELESFIDATDQEDLLARIYVKNLEVEMLMPLLEDGDHISDDKIDEFYSYVTPIEPILRDLVALSHEVDAAYSADRLAEWNDKLDEIDSLLNMSFNNIGWMLVEERRKGSPHPAPPLTSPFLHADPEGPCPCGSGRRFRECCLGKLN